MPFVELFVPESRSAAERRQLADAVHAALVETIGIPEDDLAHVIKKFARGRGASGGGSGLGLFIAGRIAEDHGGRLTIRSLVGSGTTVTVTLPVA